MPAPPRMKTSAVDLHLAGLARRGVQKQVAGARHREIAAAGDRGVDGRVGVDPDGHQAAGAREHNRAGGVEGRVTEDGERAAAEQDGAEAERTAIDGQCAVRQGRAAAVGVLAGECLCAIAIHGDAAGAGDVARIAAIQREAGGLVRADGQLARAEVDVAAGRAAAVERQHGGGMAGEVEQRVGDVRQGERAVGRGRCWRDASVPASIRVSPVCVLAPVRVSVPAPDFSNSRAPLRSPEAVAAEELLNSMVPKPEADETKLPPICSVGPVCAVLSKTSSVAPVKLRRCRGRGCRRSRRGGRRGR